MSAILLAGGASKRMGRDKRFLPWESSTMLEHGLELLCSVSSDIIVKIRHGETELVNDDRVRWLADSRSFEGPLAAIADAIPHCRYERILVHACDMPAVTPILLSALAQHLDDASADAVVPIWQKKVYPLPAILHRRSANVIQTYLDSGGRSLVGLLAQEALALNRLDLDTIDIAADWQRLLENYNTFELTKN